MATRKHLSVTMMLLLTAFAMPAASADDATPLDPTLACAVSWGGGASSTYGEPEWEWRAFARFTCAVQARGVLTATTADGTAIDTCPNERIEPICTLELRGTAARGTCVELRVRGSSQLQGSWEDSIKLCG